ncbi:IPTL-CTERM sorting domain-containing protein [Delftia lacustris]|uniref:IPTL-CTERM sorting domain-containing protein n=1 Tax=Delftia lacustris TaxID=558537 RepID=UPI0035A68700
MSTGPGAVHNASNTLGVCTVSDSTVTMVSAGICTVMVNQAGNAQWEPAAAVAVNITIDPPVAAAQSITFPAQACREFVAGGSFDIDPPAVASSGLPVSYTSRTLGVCSVSGSTVTMVGEGHCKVVASQSGDAQWLPAADVSMNIVLTAGAGPVGPTQPEQVTSVPAMGSTWSLGLMSLLAGALGWLRLRRRS